MSELQDAGQMIEAAAQAAAADDLSSADELLRGVARIQEAELGPLHPDLANTLNNLAIVAEKTGRLDDAETFYRRAVAIASASLPADDPMLAASRENLEAFCRARGLPIESAALTPPAPRAAAPPPFESPVPVPRKPTRTISEPHTPSPRRGSTSRVFVAIGVVVILVIAAVLVRRSTSSHETATPAPPAVPAGPQAADRTPPTSTGPAIPAPIEQPRPPTVGPRRDAGDVTTGTSPAPLRSPSAVTLITAQLCRRFSTSSATWRCDPVGDPVSPGPIVLYTRVISPRDTVVVHRWYRGDTLRQSVRLPVRANATEGYRTYSRQTVTAGEWRVEVRSAAGDLLHEQRVVVK